MTLPPKLQYLGSRQNDMTDINLGSEQHASEMAMPQWHDITPLNYSS